MIEPALSHTHTPDARSKPEVQILGGVGLEGLSLKRLRKEMGVEGVLVTVVLIWLWQRQLLHCNGEPCPLSLQRMPHGTHSSKKRSLSLTNHM